MSSDRDSDSEDAKDKRDARRKSDENVTPSPTIMVNSKGEKLDDEKRNKSVDEDQLAADIE